MIKTPGREDSTDVSRFDSHMPEHQTDRDRLYFDELSRYWTRSIGTDLDKLRAFPKFAPVAELGRFLAKYEIFRHVLGIHGSVIECGVFLGAGVMTWAKLSAMLEPLNHVRRVIGFDSFEGFPSVDAKDRPEQSELSRAGQYSAPALDDIQEAARLLDMYRPLGHIPKIELVAGDAMLTMPSYLKDNQHLVVSLLYLDFDIYAPTKKAIETFLPRMPKGSVLAFDELGQKRWPGETLALLESVGLRSLRIERLPFQPQISFAILD